MPLCLLSLGLLLSSCGYVGEPLPPSLQIPLRVQDLRVRQEQLELIVDFTVPAYATDGAVLEGIREIELRAGPWQGGEFHADLWASQSARLPVQTLRPGPVTVRVDGSRWIGKTIIFAVRIVSGKEKVSEWSNFFIFPVFPPPPTPQNLTMTPTPKGILIQWDAHSGSAGTQYEVWRMESDSGMQLLAITEEKQWLDQKVQFGKTYSYRVRSREPRGESFAWSAFSPPVELTYIDQFPPDPPSQVVAAVDVRTVELAWPPVMAGDLCCYRVYRIDPNGEQRLLAEVPTTQVTYTDTAVVPGSTYRYFITSVDQSKNESKPSTEVTVEVPSF